MTRYSDFPPLWHRLCQAAGLADGASIDVVHQRVSVVGRGTLQRIRSGVPGTSLKSLQAIADHLHIDLAQLVDGAPSSTRVHEPAQTYSTDLGGLVSHLADILDGLSTERATAAATALQALAMAADSARARAAVVAALQPSESNGKRVHSAA